MKHKTFLLAFLVIVLLSGVIAPPAQAQSSQAETCTRYHTVQRGEYLSQIARQYGVSWRWLAEINNLANPSRIYPRQQLCVEVSTTPPPVTCTRYHTVQRGEYLSLIAKQYGVSWRWLAEINNLANPSRIYRDQRLCVGTSTGTGGPVTPPPASQNPSFTIVAVREDETITIQVSNLPANDSFNVYMGKEKTRAVNGSYAGTIQTGAGGSVRVTLNIPFTMRDVRKVAVRMVSPISGLTAYNTFTNATSP